MQTHESLQLSGPGHRSPPLPAPAIPLVKKIVISGEKWIMGAALEKHGEFSKQKKSCYFGKGLELGTVVWFNPFSATLH